MNPKHFHTPLPTRVRCPVCREAVYSRAGIHPQCAVKQNEPPKPKEKAPVALVVDGTAVADAPAAGLLPVAENPVA